MDHCRNLFSVCSMISELKERLTAVEGEIEELKKEPPTNPPPLAPGTFLVDSELRFKKSMMTRTLANSNASLT